MTEQQLILSKSEDEIIEIRDDLFDLKGILLHNKNNKNQKVICKVPASRYFKILSDYWALNAINVDGLVETYEKHRYYYLTKLDYIDKWNMGNGNAYKIVRVTTKEIKAKCVGCNCSTKRWLNPTTGVCYFKEMINKDYTTKII